MQEDWFMILVVSVANECIHSTDKRLLISLCLSQYLDTSQLHLISTFVFIYFPLFYLYSETELILIFFQYKSHIEEAFKPLRTKLFFRRFSGHNLR